MLYTARIMVDKSSHDAILYTLTERLNIGINMNNTIKTVCISILSMLLLQGCSSTGGHQGAVFKADFINMLSRDPRLAPWDPPVGVGYGTRIPNMRGDVDRLCKTPSDCG